MTFRDGLVWTLSIVAIAFGVLVTTCDRDDASGVVEPPTTKHAEVAHRADAPTPSRRAPRQRASQAEIHAADPVRDGSDWAAVETRVGVTVKRGGNPAADVDVWLVPAAAPDAADPFAHSAAAYFGVPRYLGLWESYPPADGPDRLQSAAGFIRGKTDERGHAEFHARPDVAYTVAVTAGTARAAVTPRRDVRGAMGALQELAVEMRDPRRIHGRCIDAAGDPAGSVWVQAFESGADLPASRLVETDAAGAFTLDIPGDESTLRVRAIAKRSGPRFVLVGADAVPPAILSDTTVPAVAPGPDEVLIRMTTSPVVLLDVEGEIPVGHLQLEGLVWDESAAAWGRLGGPAYGGGGAKHVLAAIPRADAERPFCVWSWTGPMLSAVDPRGQERVSVTLRRGRKVVVRGKGWRPGDLVRVVCRTGPPGGEMDVIWTEESPNLSPTSWFRNDVPPCAVEFRILRGGRQFGSPARVAAGTEAVDEVRLDVPEEDR